MSPYLFAAFVIVCFMIVFYAIALIKKDNGVADIGWGLGFVLVAWLLYGFFSQHRMHQKMVVFFVTVWGLRLAIYLIIRNWGKPEDFRYAKWRQEWGDNVVWRSLLQVFMLQGFFMFVILLPVMVILTATYTNRELTWLYPIGAFIGATGFVIEALADWQMYCFKNDPHPHKAKVMDKGLWRYSRHPNYFGEAVQWWAMFLLAIPSGYWYVSIIGPLVITWLLLKVSGVTMLEKKYEGDDEYTRYKKRTSSFLLLPPKNI
jgi:steroid 5-alpha reductase family enzyme